MKTVAEMTEREQIERLVKQRNDLWALIDELIKKHGSDEDRKDFLQDGDLPEARCEIEDGQIIVCVQNTLESLASVRCAIDELIKLSEGIVGNTYMVEGRNQQVGENNPDMKGDAFEPYMNAPSGWFTGQYEAQYEVADDD